MECNKNTTMDTGKSYHKLQATGAAFDTVQRHATDQDITLFAGCFCPFTQRVWVALEYLEIPYKVYEVNPFKKPQELLELSPKGLVPALRLNNYSPPRALNESSVILEYLEESVCATWFPIVILTRSASLASMSTKRSLLPPLSDPYARALVRLQADHVNRTLFPAFYRYLEAQDPDAQITGGREFLDTIETLVGLFERAEREVGGTGLWKDGGELGLADLLVGPFLLRATNILKHYRGFELPRGPKFDGWLNRLLEHPAFKCTCSTDELYLDTYELYAFNRTNMTQAANAINTGRGKEHDYGVGSVQYSSLSRCIVESVLLSQFIIHDVCSSTNRWPARHVQSKSFVVFTLS
ncbi:glutathione S-transferase [Pisolithus albus]|nr:glutathione S-transferase [Pisolithus albus]